MKFKSKEKMRCGPGSVLHHSLVVVVVGGGVRLDWFGSSFAAVGF